jgi:hypothetical protein
VLVLGLKRFNRSVFLQVASQLIADRTPAQHATQSRWSVTHFFLLQLNAREIVRIISQMIHATAVPASVFLLFGIVLTLEQNHVVWDRVP